MMGSSDLSSLLEECIQELQAGSNLEEILARHPQYARELRPLLETAVWTINVRDGIQIPGNAQSLSRKAFTSAQPFKQPRAGFHGFTLRLAFSLTAIILCLVFGLLGTTLASAQALPGDTLYPVKLAWEQIQINLTSGTAQRLKLEQTFDQQRVDEVNRLINLGRTSNVTFSGILVGSESSWNVDGIELNVPDQQAGKLPGLKDTVVQVTGETEGKSVKVKEISPHLVIFNGQIQQLKTDSLQVSGVNVTLDNNTDINGDLSVNHEVHITARQEDNGELIAVTVDGEKIQASPTNIQTEPSSGKTPGSSKPGSSEKTPQPTEEEAPTPTSAIQPLMTVSPTSGPTAEQEKGSGSTRMTPTPTNSSESGYHGETRPTATPTPKPESEYPTATRYPTGD